MNKRWQTQTRWILFSLGLCTAGPVPAADSLTFEKDIRPIFKVACFHCHGEEDTKKGGLDVRLVRLMIEGGESGPALTPRSAEDSFLWQRLDSDEMPKGEKKLSQAEKELVRLWIDQGAKTARPEPADVADARFTLEELNHWAFQPVQAPPVPLKRIPEKGVSNPIDAFIGERLARAGLIFSRTADRRTLIRRLSFDLTGLPPAPDAVEAFVNDRSEAAYQRLADRLLASPQFGVRWGRHWLDASGFAETDGGSVTDADPKRPHAWRYRDYVINAFNANKPVDAFIHEQLAGDELIEDSLDIHDARDRELLTATGFLRMAPDPTRSSNTLADRNATVANALQVVSTTMLGLSVGCAQCHDHKYDPIGIDDYYRFRAVFDPAFPLNNWQTPDKRLIDTTEPDVLAEAERIETEAAALENDLNARKRARAAEIQEAKLAGVPAEVREATREAVKTESKQRTSQQEALLDLYPMVKPIDYIIGLLVEYDGPAYRAFEKEREEIAALRATKPPSRKIMATTEPRGEVPVSHVFFRGDPESPRDVVEPGELRVLKRPGRVPADDADRPTTGRRLAYARQLTDGTHPLTARVFVNRLWMHHLGRGLVATPGDFGIAGERPSHPELLDWLATEFVQQHWDQKRLHRMIVLSATYRQQSRRRSELDRVDPENALFGRANLRRLEAEAIRDALLAVAGNLNTRLGGSSVPVAENAEGKAVIGVEKLRDGLPDGIDPANADASRRSAFIEVQRRLPLDMLGTFDQPVMMPNCEARRHTTVATQALWFLNDTAMLSYAHALAQRLQSTWPDRSEQLEQMFLRLFGQQPTARERIACEAFLAEQETFFAENQATKKEAPLRALASLCQVFLASNRFLYVD